MTDQKSFNQLENEHKTRMCPECKSKRVEYENGEIICRDCGLIIE